MPKSPETTSRCDVASVSLYGACQCPAVEDAFLQLFRNVSKLCSPVANGPERLATHIQGCTYQRKILHCIGPGGPQLLFIISK